MKRTQLIMGMPITIEVIDPVAKAEDLQEIFAYFISIDKTFSTYKSDSEISRYNKGIVAKEKLSRDVKEILQLAEDTKKETNGFFNIQTKNGIDPSGIVKGWAIYNASLLLQKKGFKNFFIDAGGDIQTAGKNRKGEKWTVGITNPFKADEFVKVLKLQDNAVATSGIYNRGAHIYNPHKRGKSIDEIVSLTVVGPNIYDADRFATAAFAMGRKGIQFIGSLSKFAGYMIDKTGKATVTNGFEKFVI